MITFSRTVSSKSSVSSCGTTPRWERMAAPSRCGSSPRMLSVPSDGGETHPIIRMVELFPAPFGPRNPKASPLCTSKSIPSTATISSKRFTNPRAWMSGVCSETFTGCNLPGTRAVKKGAMEAAIAAGHPATAAAGLEILAEGGSTADATVAAALASCVAETVMTGLLGGGHAIYWDAAAGRARILDCFCAVPGLGADAREAELVHLQVPFGAELVHYAIGPASCAVPGVPAGLGALWQAHGRLPWARLFAPALRLARDGVEMPPAHVACLTMLEPVMTMKEGARIYAPGGTLLRAGERLDQP